MGKCYCDYCDVFLTNDSVAVRKQHNDGNRHKYNVCEYYRNYMGQQLQERIDDIVQQFEIKVARSLIRPTYGLPPAVKVIKELERAASSSENQFNISDQPNHATTASKSPSNDEMKTNSHPEAPHHDSAKKTSPFPTTSLIPQADRNGIP